MGSPEIWEQGGVGRGGIGCQGSEGAGGWGGEVTAGHGVTEGNGVTEGHRMTEEAEGRLEGCWGRVM